MLSIALITLLLQGSDAFLSKLSASTVRSQLVMKAVDTDAKEVSLSAPNGAKATVRSFGCNTYSYVTADGIEVFGKRKDTGNPAEESKPYSGGVPHCFPQFGPGKIQQHGFARNSNFIPSNIVKESAFEKAVFKLIPNDISKSMWDYNFEYQVDVTLKSDCIEFDLSVLNKGDKAFDVTLGLHTYFDVSSVKNVVVKGPFQGQTFVDRIAGSESTYPSAEFQFKSFIDGYFKGVSGPITISDSGKGTVTTLESVGFTDTVVWCPVGDEKMDNDKFICVEPVVTQPITIPVGSKPTKFHHKVTCTKV